MTTFAFDATNISDDSMVDKATKSSKAFTCGALRLKVQQEFLDKTVASAICRLKPVDRQHMQEISTLYSNLNNKRCQEIERLHKAMLLIVELWKDVKDGVSSMERLQSLDLATYRKNVLHLEKKLAKFKENSTSMFQICEETEIELNAKLNGVERKLDDWSEPINSSFFKTPVRSIGRTCTFKNDNIKEEVQTFQRMLEENGGHTGRWDEQDHLLFLRLRNKHKGRASFLSLLRQHLPDIPADEILKHEHWYQHYLDLKSKRKQAIQQWKFTREEKKREKSAAEHKVLKMCTKIRLQNSSNEKKRQLEEWKKTLELKKQLEEKKEWDERQNQLENEQKKKEFQEMKKAQVEQYKEEKKAQEQNKWLMQQMKELKETEDRVARANSLIKVFRSQDERFISRRRNLCMAKVQQKEQELKQLRGKVNIVVERDPERLLRPTELWKERCRQKKLKNTESRPLLHVCKIPHLSVPEWRKSVVQEQF